LVDTGLSSKYDGNLKFHKIYCVDRSRTLRHGLAECGLTPSDIHYVLNTHLHFDHAGGNTEIGPDGKILPQFPKARYVVQKEEWEDAQSPHERNLASYLKENYEPLDDCKALELVSGEFAFEPGLKVIRSGGHTRGHQCIMIESEGQTAIFFGDLIPTRSHVPLPWIMGYDLFPVHTLEAKRSLLARAKKENWLLLFQHDPLQRAGYIKEADGRDMIVPLATT
jgi:glyoxylase-like metal-dependent hydrolase (beta-lactamase superfamily II)